MHYVAAGAVDRMDLSETFCGQTYLSDENFKCFNKRFFVKNEVRQSRPRKQSIQCIRVAISFDGDHVTFTYCSGIGYRISRLLPKGHYITRNMS